MIIYIQSLDAFELWVVLDNQNVLIISNHKIIYTLLRRS